MLVSVAADKRNPSSWSARVPGGAWKSTTFAVKNTGDRPERVTLAPATYVTDSSRTIVKTITLTDETDHGTVQDFTVPSGTDFVQVRYTWPSGSDVSIRTAVCDSVGNFVTYAPTYGGYGHLSMDQISWGGPADQRPVVKRGAPWQVAIFPHASMTPTGPQRVNLRVEFLHKTRWSAPSLSSSTVRLQPRRSASVGVSVRAPRAAGTYFGGVAVGNGATTTTVPVAIRVPVTITGKRGAFSGKITGSTAECYGGEFHFYDFTVPRGTKSVAASVAWQHEGNLVNMYLVDPDGHVRDAKGGDLWAADYAAGEVPLAAFTHTAEQVIWKAPQPGKWQVLLWAPGFAGDSFAEPYSGTITLDGGSVSPAEWAVEAAPGEAVTTDFTVSNRGPTALSAYATSQMTLGGVARFDNVMLEPYAGVLEPTPENFASAGSFTLPQEVALVTASATWDQPGTLVDLGLFDPTGTDTAGSLAATGRSPRPASIAACMSWSPAAPATSAA